MSSRARYAAFRRSIPRTPPMAQQTVRVRGGSLAVFTSPPVAGAPPLLCINGGMLYDHAMLWPALSPLAPHRQLVLYDQRGRGRSEPPADLTAASIEDDAADVGALRRALGIRRWDILGHSWGGGIALLGAAADSGGTRRIVTVDAVGATSAWMAPLRAAALGRLEGEERAALARIDEQSLAQPDPEIHGAQARAVYPAWFADRELARVFAAAPETSATGAAVLARLRREGYDWRPILRALSVPTLVIHGEQDAMPIAASDELAAVLPDAQRVLLPHAGHMPFWEAPERFFSLVDAFLEAPVPGVIGPPL